MESSTERLTGKVAGVFGKHIFIDTRTQSYFAHREELDFSDPCICLSVTFHPGAKAAHAGLPYALDVRKA